MRRLCERPGCGASAAVSYGIDNEKLVVWIDSAPALDPARAGTLCRRHADALSVPKGWHIDDRRQPVPMLFPARDITPAEGTPKDAPTGSARKENKKISSDTSNNETLFSEPVAVATSVSEPTPVPVEVDDEIEEKAEPVLEETKAIPWTPRLIETDGKDDTASITKGRLLGRAFGERPRKTAEE